MLAVAAMTCIIAITVKSVVALVMLCVDIPYCIMFPQLTCVLYAPITNAYGSFLGFFIGLFFRLAGGEHFLGIPALIRYPWYNEEHELNVFPFKTLTTIISFTCILGGSWLARELARSCAWFRKADGHLFQSFCDVSEKDKIVMVPLNIDMHPVNGKDGGHDDYIGRDGDDREKVKLRDSDEC